MFNEKMAGAINPIGMIQDSYNLIEKEQRRLKATGRYVVRISD